MIKAVSLLHIFQEKNKIAISSLLFGFAFLKIEWSTVYTGFRTDTLI